jgi:microcystin-dependent protein
MARAEIPLAVTKTSDGSAVSGANVQVNLRSGGPATIYSAESGGGTIGNPLTTTAEGRIEGWLDEGSYTLLVSGSGISSYTQYLEVVRGDGVSKYAAGSIGAAALSSAVAQALLPPASVVPYAGPSAPAGFLLANGSTVSRTTYAALFAVIGTTYNTGGEAGTDFRLPDYRGRTLVGLGTHSDVNALTKNEGVSTVANRKPKHSHTRGTLTVSSATTGVTTQPTGSHNHGGSVIAGGNHNHGGSTSQLDYNPDVYAPVVDGGNMWSMEQHGGNVGSGYYIPSHLYGAQGAANLDHSHAIGFSGDHNHGINFDGSHSHTINDSGHVHSTSGRIGDTTSATDVEAPAFQVVNFLIKI